MEGAEVREVGGEHKEPRAGEAPGRAPENRMTFSLAGEPRDEHEAAPHGTVTLVAISHSPVADDPAPDDFVQRRCPAGQ